LATLSITVKIMLLDYIFHLFPNEKLVVKGLVTELAPVYAQTV